MSMRLTDRDCALMRWINCFGFVNVSQIALWMDVGLSMAYARSRKLVVHGYLKHRKVAHDSGIYVVTRRGIQVANSTLPPLKKLSLQTYNHNTQVVTLSLALLRCFGGHYVTERELRHEFGQENFGKKIHFSDGDLILGQKRIAIEVELNKKSKRRRDIIFNHYQKQFHYQEVWYFYSNHEVRQQLEPYTKLCEWLRLFSLDEFVNKSGYRLEHKAQSTR